MSSLGHIYPEVPAYFENVLKSPLLLMRTQHPRPSILPQIGLIIVFPIPISCIFSASVQSESGCANIVSAAPCQAEPQQYEVQFGRLRNFLTGKYSAPGATSYQERIMQISLGTQYIPGMVYIVEIPRWFCTALVLSITIYWNS